MTEPSTEPSRAFTETTILVLLIFFIVFLRGLASYLNSQSQAVLLSTSKNVAIFVLGDIGRSPRMQYHALSFAQNGWNVDFIGYNGASPLISITEDPKIKIHYLTHPWHFPDKLPKLLFFIYAPFKVYFQILLAYWVFLVRIKRPDFVLVQNPPSIPTLMIIQFICWIRSTNLIIDWHNFGFTILGIRLGQNSRIVKFAKWYEQFYGRRAYAHLTVTGALHRELMYKWNVEGNISTLYDRPPSHFKRLSLDEIHEFFTRFDLEKIISEQSIGSDFLPPSSSNSTFLTMKNLSTNQVTFRNDRPILIVSSTSWTADEDFSMLLKAAHIYDETVEKSKHQSESSRVFPKLVFVITGKGPLKDKYEEEISKMLSKNIRIVTAWLSFEDYPMLLGSADLGICLHTSSSGMDLPMKVVDMFGCGLPVCAFDYKCLDELVRHNRNGLVFKNGEQLAEQLIDLFTNYPNTEIKLDAMRKNIIEFQKERWDDNWKRVMIIEIFIK
nr:9102_t:CDS:10 [Entrophospora candida]